MDSSIDRPQYTLGQTLSIASLVMQYTPYAFCLFDQELKLLFWSRELQKMTGLEEAKVKGTRLDLFLPFLKTEQKKLEHCLDGTGGITDDIVFEIPETGFRGRFQLQYIPLKVSQNSPTWGIILFKDRTIDLQLQNQLIESEDRFKHMADSAPVYLWMTREDGMSVYFNKSWLEFRGRTLEEEKGLGWAQGIHPDDFQKSMHIIFTNLNKRQAFEVEFRLLNAQGQYRWMTFKGIPRLGVENRFTGFTGSCVDITEHKVLINELKSAKQAADNASVIKTQFLANVSHEIRTPLGIILGFAEIIRNENISDTERNNLLDRILKSGNQLLHIVDDVLDVSKVEANKIEVELIDFSLFDLIKEIRELFELRAQEKGLQFKTYMTDNIPSFIKSDPTRIRQILTNVIGNSIKFTKQGQIELKISTAHREGNKCQLEFEIHDTGVGLHSESKERIFKPFSQEDASTTRKFGGTGLGLHLSRKLAQILGGDLNLVKSEIGKGSTFCLKLPVEAVVDSRADNQSHSAEQKTTYENLNGLRILVVDDAEENRILLGRYLQPYKVAVSYAHNGEEAVQISHKEKFDLILMDIQMPVLDGYGALKQIRTFNRETPVIALTAHALKTERDRCLEFGFNEHVAKPVNKQKLISYISSLISQKDSNIMSKTW